MGHTFTEVKDFLSGGISQKQPICSFSNNLFLGNTYCLEYIQNSKWQSWFVLLRSVKVLAINRAITGLNIHLGNNAQTIGDVSRFRQGWGRKTQWTKDPKWKSHADITVQLPSPSHYWKAPIIECKSWNE